MSVRVECTRFCKYNVWRYFLLLHTADVDIDKMAPRLDIESNISPCSRVNMDSGRFELRCP